MIARKPSVHFAVASILIIFVMLYIGIIFRMNFNATRPTGLLFDLDGVLIDTESLYSKFWGAMGKMYLPNKPTFANDIKGTNLCYILNTYFPSPLTQTEITAKLEEFQSEMKFSIFDGVTTFIGELKQMGLPYCIVTSSDEAKMRRLYHQQPFFKTEFQHIVTGDQVTKSKPDPECFLKGAQTIGVNIHDCIVFEDSIQGVQAAIASGARVIALTTTNTAEVMSRYTSHILGSLKDFTVRKMYALLDA